MTELIFGMDPAVPGSMLQNRTRKPCEILCAAIDQNAAQACLEVCSELDARETGWFDMENEQVAEYVNAVGRALVISQVQNFQT